MCGITGMLDPLARFTTDELQSEVGNMTEVLSHRGPDSGGLWVDPRGGLALGQRRLSILDLSEAGNQPMVSPSGRYVTVFNGEIYNFRQLAVEMEALGHRFQGHSDTEVLTAGFDQWGFETTLKRTIGMFAISVWDREQRELLMAVDRAGEKPLYWGRSGGMILFGSELKAIRAISHPSPEIDRDALSLFFRHKYIPAPFTVYRGFQKLQPGQIVRVDACGEAVTSVYWSAFDHYDPNANPPPVGDRDVVDEVAQLVTESVRARMVSDVPLGAFLSGGIDSTVVVASMQSASDQPIRTFTIGSEDRRFDESPAASAVASALGTKHTDLIISSQDMLDVVPRLAEIYDEPFADSSQIPTVLVSTLARQDVTVALSGDGGDEVFGGYNRYTWVPRLWSRLERIPRSYRLAIADWLGRVPPHLVDSLSRAVPRRVRPALAGEKLTKLAAVIDCASAEEMFQRLTSHWTKPDSLVLGATEPTTIVTSPQQWPKGGAIEKRMMAVDLVSYLPGDILTKVDRASMSVGLEARVPFLDHRLLEMSLSQGWFAAGQPSKWILREIARRHVPADFLERPKMGFGVPMGEWLRGPLRQWAGDLLSVAEIRRQGFLDGGQVESLWLDHQEGTHDNTYKLWDIAVFQAWLDRWTAD